MPSPPPPPIRFAVAIVAPPGYPYAHAFREVAETVHHGLRALGHDSVLTTRADWPDRRTIVFGANTWGAAPVQLRPDAILYNLEQIYPGSPWLTPALVERLRMHRVWDYSRANIQALAEMGIHHAVHVPIGAMPQLTRIPPAADEDIDVLFYGALVDRRLRVLRALRGEGVAVTALFGTFGAARDQAIARARIVLNMHLHEAKLFEMVRVSYLLANRRFVISESGQGGADEAAFTRGLVFADYEDLVATCLDYLNRPADRQRIADEGFALMTARSETEILRAVLAAA
jgi:hypothetical protein